MSRMKDALIDLCEAHGLNPCSPDSWERVQRILDREALAWDADRLELPAVAIAYLNGEPLVVELDDTEPQGDAIHVASWDVPEFWA